MNDLNKEFPFCKKHNELREEFICSCQRPICSKCIENHRCENMTIKLRKDINTYFIREIEQLDDLMAKININIEISNCISDLVTKTNNIYFEKLINKNFEEISRDIKLYRNKNITDSEMIEFISRKYTSKIVELQTEMINKTSILKNIFSKNIDNIKEDYINLLNKYFQLDSNICIEDNQEIEINNNNISEFIESKISKSYINPVRNNRFSNSLFEDLDGDISKDYSNSMKNPLNSTTHICVDCKKKFDVDFEEKKWKIRCIPCYKKYTRYNKK